jgi:cytoskeletal protein RodZ
MRAHSRRDRLGGTSLLAHTPKRVPHSRHGRFDGTVIEIGASLAQARVRLGLGFAEAVEGTRLRERYLRALEQEQFDQLPPGSYPRAFLRTYAAFLELDADLLVEEYVTRYERHESRHTTAPPPIPVERPSRRRRR